MSPHSDDITPKSRIRFESRRIPAGPESPTPYPCTQAVMSDLQLPHCSPLASDSLPRLSLRAAVERLESFHAPSRPRSSSPGELLALLQLRDRLPALRDQDASSEHSCAWHADVAHKVFPDLDHALFEGVLQGKVCLTWETEEGQHERHLCDERKLVGKSAVTHIQHGRTVRSGQDARIWIRLNANVLLLDARKTLTDVISVLVHEMVVSCFSPLFHPCNPKPNLMNQSTPTSSS